jgi:hypothetical protein
MVFFVGLAPKVFTRHGAAFNPAAERRLFHAQITRIMKGNVRTNAFL